MIALTDLKALIRLALYPIFTKPAYLFLLFGSLLVIGFAVISMNAFAIAQSADQMEKIRRDFGSDLEIAVGYRSFTDDEIVFLGNYAPLSITARYRAMMRVESASGPLLPRLAMVRAIDEYYPLLGGLTTEDGQTISDVNSELSLKNGYFGALIDPSLASQIGLNLGDIFSLGDVEFRVAGIIGNFPDRLTTSERMASVVVVPYKAIENEKILKTYSAQMISADVEEIRSDANRAFDISSWQIRTPKDVTTRASFLDTLSKMMSLTTIFIMTSFGAVIFAIFFVHLEEVKADEDYLIAIGLSRYMAIGLYLVRFCFTTFFTITLILPTVSGLLTIVANFFAIETITSMTLKDYQWAIFLSIVDLVLLMIIAALFAYTRARSYSKVILFPMQSIFIVTLLFSLSGNLPSWRALWMPLFLTGAIVVAFYLLARMLFRLVRYIHQPHNLLTLSLRQLTSPYRKSEILATIMFLNLLFLTVFLGVQSGIEKISHTNFTDQIGTHLIADIQRNQRDEIEEAIHEYANAPTDFIEFFRGTVQGINSNKRDQQDHWFFSNNNIFRVVSELPKEVEIRTGDFDGNNPSAVINADLAKDLGIGIGDYLDIEVAGDVNSIPISGLFDASGSIPYFGLLVYISPKSVQKVATSFMANVEIFQKNEGDFYEKLLIIAPNLTIISTERSQRRLIDLFDFVTLRLNIVVLFFLISSMPVLIVFVAMMLRKARYEFTLLRMLGASKVKIAWLELTRLGVIASLTLIFSLLIGWLITNYFLDQVFLISAQPSLVLMGAAALIWLFCYLLMFMLLLWRSNLARSIERVEEFGQEYQQAGVEFN